eukprot:CAMPEP_0170901336 /NCGR_PEP_ID=MMETSP0734-20130129/48362_1 /TAXON_ID=186038 /ORGANISM="Fragilariopsis kerguelensis, Strain L26-C5" /LENGTH=128 /DNA_ID=CAMNT_0011295815 /DNA_START=55 /DNA_END=442 /DNA_ORIENTATION=+
MAIETATPEEVIRTRRQSWMEWIGGEEVTEQGQQYRYYSYSTNEEGIPRMETERCTTTIITTPSIQYNTLSVVIIRVGSFWNQTTSSSTSRGSTVIAAVIYYYYYYYYYYESYYYYYYYYYYESNLIE